MKTLHEMSDILCLNQISHVFVNEVKEFDGIVIKTSRLEWRGGLYLSIEELITLHLIPVKPPPPPTMCLHSSSGHEPEYTF